MTETQPWIWPDQQWCWSSGHDGEDRALSYDLLYLDEELSVGGHIDHLPCSSGGRHCAAGGGQELELYCSYDWPGIGQDCHY